MFSWNSSVAKGLEKMMISLVLDTLVSSLAGVRAWCSLSEPAVYQQFFMS